MGNQESFASAIILKRTSVGLTSIKSRFITLAASGSRVAVVVGPIYSLGGQVSLIGPEPLSYRCKNITVVDGERLATIELPTTEQRLISALRYQTNIKPNAYLVQNATSFNKCNKVSIGFNIGL